MALAVAYLTVFRSWVPAKPVPSLSTGSRVTRPSRIDSNRHDESDGREHSIERRGNAHSIRTEPRGLAAQTCGGLRLSRPFRAG